MDSLQSTLLLLGLSLGVAAAGVALLFLLRKTQVNRQSNLDKEIRLLGFERVEWDETLRDTFQSLDLGPESDSGLGAIYHLRRGEADYYLIEGSLMSSSNASGFQYSMLVTSAALGLPRMATIPKLQFEGLIGRLFDEIMERIPMGALQSVDLHVTEPFRLFALSPMQAKAFFDGWRLAQSTELSEGFVSCGGNAFLCALMAMHPDHMRQTSFSSGINRLYECAQSLLAGFVQ